MVIFIMCHILEIRGIKDFNYRRIGLAIYVEFSLGNRYRNFLKITQNRIQNTQNLAVACVTIRIATVHLIYIEKPASPPT